jgi:NAD(P)-dependent dehydrogenase (short-subunit alcohol dehydrogenase family)
MASMGASPPGGRRTVLITWTTSGIGREAARQLARLGVRVVMGVRGAERGNAIAGRIRAEGGVAELLPLDLASFASVRDATTRLAGAFAVSLGRRTSLLESTRPANAKAVTRPAASSSVQGTG